MPVAAGADRQRLHSGRIMPKLTDDELQKLHNSADALKKVIAQMQI